MAVMTTDMTVEEAAKLSLDEQFTRYPVMKDSKDDIVGVINSRDLFNVFVKKTLAQTDSFNP
ncbi:CBS domain-containing protein [Carnobacterium maltaromaticum]|uniref:CBS domain-containing protein n=1 Tax=Carnobacterium maltaromaticum TaxID=2751 RepID=UPI0039BDC437